MGCGFSHFCGAQGLHDEDLDLAKSPPPRKRTFFRSNSFKSGVLIKSTTLEVKLHRQEVDEDDFEEITDVSIEEEEYIGDEPFVYVGGGIPGVAVDEFTIEQAKYTGHSRGGRRAFSQHLAWGSRTRAGNDSMGRRKENQDSFIVRDRFAGIDALTFVCVMDGHGAQGAFVSHYVRDRYPHHVADALLRHMTLMDSSTTLDPSAITLETIEDVFLDASCRMTIALEEESQLDISVSGTTAIALLFINPTDSLPHIVPRVFIANVGDSRAVAGVLSPENDTYIPHILSSDHKPNVPSEEARIVATNGRVFEYGVPRVWLQDIDMPGLAMSRSFGDSIATSVGVISDPCVTELDLTPGTFVVVASDGLWEFMPSEQVIDMCAKCISENQDPQTTCDMLVAEALERWLDEEDVVDDITVLYLTTCVPSPE
ncbi:unnamed protein product [Aphanomyces euteiches]|uniref:PPM-type phosphatase domain-containing protein n=1 Tax=Aphanomyces euteiches TaxID=100861 RepID=A0A6G0X8X6_9STRA|nr:hypothetical protein Ae201684_007535 [Aphanomyces euteiches]KAH9101013.1 hypothetical protein Ae201684P_007202 [Aphanomyces euteiches]